MMPEFSEKPYEVIGLAPPFVDHIIHVSDEFLATIPGAKGCMEDIDYCTMRSLIENSSSGIRTPGGSAANTIRGLAHLQHQCAILGGIGADEEGQWYLKILQDLGIVSLCTTTTTPTSQSVILVTSDGQRTFRSFHGACAEITINDLEACQFEGTRLLHVEGYNLLYEDVARRAMELAKDAGAKVSFDLASFNLVTQHREIIKDLVTNYVDIVFANKGEIEALFGLVPKEGCDALRDTCEIAVVLLGKEGCWIGNNEGLIRCPAYPVKPLDTTGANDLFAAGFLHGYLHHQPLTQCAHNGAIIARAVVQVLGAELPTDTWKEISKTVNHGVSC